MAKDNKKQVSVSGVQRILSVVALIGLVACGVMIGVAISKKQHNTVSQDVGMQMSKGDCRDIINRMTASNTSAEELMELNKIYNDNCAGRVFDKPVVKEEVKDVAVQEGEQLKETCVVVEEALLEHLPFAENHPVPRIERAKIFANLSERGCPENSAKYVEMAKQELAVARALQDDEFSEGDTIEVVETYKRLNMQAAAEEIFETAKKLTDPAIDFIIQVEKIINEQ